MYVPKRFQDCSFENWIAWDKTDEELVAELKSGIKRNLIIIGGVGCGKTHLMWAYTKQHPDTYFIRAKQLIDLIRSQWNKQLEPFETYASEDAKKAPLLILDEVGVQYGSDSERVELYDVLNYRWENELPTVLISNNTPDDLHRILGQRIFDRMIDGGKIYQLNGCSQRRLAEDKKETDILC